MGMEREWRTEHNIGEMEMERGIQNPWKLRVVRRRECKITKC